MKKTLLSFLMALFMMLSAAAVCHAGDIPEGLLDTDSAQVYFGEVSHVDGERITVIQRQNIKGEFTENSEHTYENYSAQTQGAQNPSAGETYLCGFLDEHNPLYIWEVSSLEPANSEIGGTAEKSEMTKRMQGYLNEGIFAEKEQERLARLETDNADEMEKSAAGTSSEQADTAEAGITDAAGISGGSGHPITVAVIGLAAIAILGLLIFLRKKKQ